MISLIVLLSSVVLCTAQLNGGPQSFAEQRDNGKQFVTQDFTYIVAPFQLNAQKDNRDANQENREAFLRYVNSSPVEGAQNENREESNPVSNENEDSFYREVQELISSGRLINGFSEQKPVEQEQQSNVNQQSQLQKQILDVIRENEKSQEEIGFSEELQKQWSRILGNNQDSRLLSSDSERQLGNEAQSEAQRESKENSAQKSADIGNGIQYILRNHGIEGLERENIFGSEQSNYQNKPFVFQQEKPLVDNQALLKALSAIGEADQSANVARSEQSSRSNLNEGEQENEVRKAIEDILRNRENNRQNRFGLKQSNNEYSPVIVLRNNLKQNREQSKQSNIQQEGRRNYEIRKLIQDVLRNRKQNNFESQSSPIDKQRQEQISNRIHLKASSAISQEQLSKEFSPFGKIY